MKFGVFTVVIPEYSPAEAVQILKECGYDGVEWRVGDGVPHSKPANYTFENRYWSYNRCTLDIKNIESTAYDIKRICTAAGMETCSLDTYLTPGNTEDIQRVLKVAVLMNCKNVRVLAPGYDEKENYRVLVNRTLKQVEQLEKMAKEHGVRINFEQHMNTIIPSASAAYRLVSSFDPHHIGIIFDPGNMVFEGFENFRMTVELLGEYLAHVHIKNSFWKHMGIGDNGIHTWKPDWAPLKTGFADLGKAVGVLKENGYAGYLCLEDFSNDVDTKTKLKESIEFLKTL